METYPARIVPRLNVLGIAWMVWSGITAAGGLVVALLAAGVGGLATAFPDEGDAPAALGWFFGGVGIALGALLLAFGLFGVFAGSALRRGERWAVVACALLGVLQLSNAPFGTALAIWTFVVAVQELGEPKGPMRTPPMRPI